MSKRTVEDVRSELNEETLLEREHAARADKLRNEITALMRKYPNGAFVEAENFTGSRRFKAVIQSAHCDDHGTAVKYELRLTRHDGEIHAGRSPVFVSEYRIVRLIQKP